MNVSRYNKGTAAALQYDWNQVLEVSVTISLSDTYYGCHPHIYSFPLTHAYPICNLLPTLFIRLLI
jgi:hypothetical protein